MNKKNLLYLKFFTQIFCTMLIYLLAGIVFFATFSILPSLLRCTLVIFATGALFYRFVLDVKNIYSNNKYTFKRV